MEKPLFANVGGNRFRLLTESIDNGLDKSSLVREGLKKVFSAGNKELSYKRVGGVGLGYIKNVSEASKTALQEARVLAKEYGYRDNESQSKFIKEDGELSDFDIASSESGFQSIAPRNKKHSESGTDSPDETEEVALANKILLAASLLKKYLVGKVDVESGSGTGATLRTIEECAQKLIQMHQGQ